MINFFALIGLLTLACIVFAIGAFIIDHVYTIYQGVDYWKQRALYAEDRLHGYGK